MNETEKQAWLDGLKVGDVVFCSYRHSDALWRKATETMLTITKVTPTQFVTGGIGLRFKRADGKIIGSYSGGVLPLSDEIKQRLAAEKLHRKLCYWFTELKANDLTTEELTAMKKAYEGVTK